MRVAALVAAAGLFCGTPAFATLDIRWLRRVLKLLWRRYQLRCVDVQEDDDC
jgi:hypothetical protein